MKKSFALLSGIVSAAMAFAAPAAADPQGDYLNALAGQGLEMNPLSSHAYVLAGNKACDDMHAGMSSVAAKGELATEQGSNPAIVPVLVNTAQQTLCTDTLGR